MVNYDTLIKKGKSYEEVLPMLLYVAPYLIKKKIVNQKVVNQAIRTVFFKKNHTCECSVYSNAVKSITKAVLKAIKKTAYIVIDFDKDTFEMVGDNHALCEFIQCYKTDESDPEDLAEEYYESGYDWTDDFDEINMSEDVLGRCSEIYKELPYEKQEIVDRLFSGYAGILHMADCDMGDCYIAGFRLDGTDSIPDYIKRFDDCYFMYPTDEDPYVYVFILMNGYIESTVFASHIMMANEE